MVPPQHADAARRELARVRGLAAREFGLRLRVGLAAVGELRRHGSDVRVGRYEPSPGNSFGVFAGGGVGLLEATVRGRGSPELLAAAAIADSWDDGEPADLSGLSCRWDVLRSQRGRMVTLIVQGATDLRDIHADIMGLTAQHGDPRPVRLDTLRTRWPPKGFMLEARAPARRQPRAVDPSRPRRDPAGLVGVCARAPSGPLRPRSLSTRDHGQYRLLQARQYAVFRRRLPAGGHRADTAVSGPLHGDARCSLRHGRRRHGTDDVSRHIDHRQPARALRGRWRRGIHQCGEGPEVGDRARRVGDRSALGRLS